MAKPIRTIEVFPNPYAGLCPDGIPQGVVQMPGTRNYVGAHLDLVACEQTGKTRFYFAAPQDGETGVQGLRKVTVPFTAEIARAVLEGGLIVAHPDHARMCGLSSDDFAEADAQLTAERARAIAERQAQYGSDATVGEVPTSATPRPEAGAVKAAPADPRNYPVMKGKPLAGPANNPSVVLRTAPEGA